ncbi:hypothetical protein D9M70_625650 [compost metagenome]
MGSAFICCTREQGKRFIRIFFRTIPICVTGTKIVYPLRPTFFSGPGVPFQCFLRIYIDTNSIRVVIAEIIHSLETTSVGCCME